MTHCIIPPRIGMPMGPEQSYPVHQGPMCTLPLHYHNVIMDVLVALTNANSQPLQVVPWTSHSALVLSTLALFIASEGECWSSTTTSSLLIRLLPVVTRHQLALWIVPLYRSGHWSCGLHTEHSLNSRPNCQRHVRMWGRQGSSAILQVSSRHWSERRCKEDERLRQSTLAV